MTDSNKKVPKLRFPGFTDVWEQRKFGDLYKKVNEKNDLSFTKDRVISVANMYFKNSDDIRSDESYMKTYNIFRKGDIAFEGNRSRHFSYGRFVENTIGDGIVSHVFDVFRPMTEFDLNYWKYAIHNERIMGPILMTATTSSTMMTNLVAKDFLKRVTLVPSVSEQNQIGSFYKQLDNLIILHQRKLSDVQKLKSGLLQKMFSKNGESTPEIRFPEFNNAWEQRVLGEVVTRAKKTSEECGIPRIEYEDIVSGQGVLNKNVFEKKSYKKGIEFKYGDILFGKLRPYLKNWLLAEFSGIAVGDWWVLRSNELDNKFVYSLIQAPKYQMVANLAIGTKMPRSDWKVVSQTKFEITKNQEEQVKIGAFFANIDNLITLHQRKLEHLQQQKKALLQQMFI